MTFVWQAHAERCEQELRNRIASLQEDLDNNEATQQDFVQLSQSLQMELERLREAEKEVRWQHEDDIDECSGCKAPFTVTRRKKNCRHCGRIFCPSCLPHQVASGPKQRLNKVCAVCHTLLVRDSAPYFSKRLPHTPDYEMNIFITMETEETVENGIPADQTTEIENNGFDEADQVQTLHQRVKQLEEEKIKIQEEFGQQRAKMKELYVQKETECKREAEECNRLVTEVRRLEVELGEAQSQLLAVGFQQESDLLVEKQKCQTEISSLQQLIQETVEESSSSRSKYESEIRRLRVINEQLDTELQELRNRKLEAGMASLPPQSAAEGGVAGVLSPSMISAVTKSLARKVVSLAPSASNSIIPSAATFSSPARAASPTPSDVTPAENLDDCMRKAQEDAEVLRSLVVPLEQEIKALKDKLRSTDEQLQWYQAHVQFSLSQDEARTTVDSCVVPASPGPRSVPSTTPVPAVGCDMCANYETQLQKVQQQVTEQERQNKLLQRASDRYREDLAKETEFRKEMENKWSEKKEEHKVQVERLSAAVIQSEQSLKQLTESFTVAQTLMSSELQRLSREREQVHKRLIYLQAENEKLVGKHSAKAAELQDERINLPDSVEELQVLLLQTREELIAAKVGKESAEEQHATLQSELNLVRHEMGTQLQSCTDENEQLRKALVDLKTLKAAEHALQIVVADLKKELAETKRAKVLSFIINQPLT
ncbi:hypothetical protein B566_EDAN003475 [Ephemera danica]|nr:hypothetical protein B566_EDAN003475 [Ephemera danica]